MKNMMFEKKIALLILVIGLVLMFLIPTWQIPDEFAHLNMIGMSLENNEFASIIEENIDVARFRMEFNYNEKIDFQEFQEALIKMPGYDRNEMIKGINFSFIKHFPAALGIVIGVILGIPAYWVLQLGEFFSLLFYVIVCYNALKIMPIKKELYAIVMLTPMALQQASGLGYDAVLIPLCFYWISYAFYLQDKSIVRGKDLLWGIFILVIIAYVKLPYVFLGTLIFMLPLENIYIKIGKLEINGNTLKAIRIPVIGVGACFSIVFLYLFRDNQRISIIIGMIKEWPRSIWLFVQTGKEYWDDLIISTVGNFGWLDTPIRLMVALAFFVILVFFAVCKNGEIKEEKKGGIWNCMVIYGTLLVMCVLITISMVNHTIMIILFGTEHIEAIYDIQTALYQIPYIGGLQGRYYLPFISLFFLPLPQVIEINTKWKKIGLFMFEMVLYVYVLYVLLCRYWIVS